jgi:hypothetical protein
VAAFLLLLLFIIMKQAWACYRLTISGRHIKTLDKPLPSKHASDSRQPNMLTYPPLTTKAEKG